MLRVLHLVGSAVDDFHADLSRLYAADCLQATRDPERYEVHLAYVTPDGGWRFPAGLSPAQLDAAGPVAVDRAITQIIALGIDVVVPQMFCRPGMTTYRGLFDVLGIPYVGNRPEVMALGADKAKAKAVVAAAGVAVPSGEIVRRGDQVRLDPPAVVKPVDADNSFGVSLVRQRSEYAGAVAAALGHSERALIERYVELGREVRCAIVERDGGLIGLPLEEYSVDPDGKPIRGMSDKLRRDDGNLALVAKDADHAWIVDTDDPLTEVVWNAAKVCHGALGARHYSLFDFRIDPSGRPWFLEAGLYCSFARQSVIAVMARAAGIDINDLFDAAVQLAITPSG